MSTDIRDPARVTVTAPVNLAEIEALARPRIGEMALAYVAGGAGDEGTLRRNREAFEAIRLAPRMLVDVGRIDTRLELLSERLDFPILLAPTGFQRLFHDEGEKATARGAAAAGALYVASTAATTAIEDIAAAAPEGRRWFQLYVQRDRGFTRELVRRAEDAGCSALVLTVDTPLLGTRDRERRVGMALPPNLALANLAGLATAELHGAPFHADLYNPFLDPTVTWEIVPWLKSFARVPVLLKGILTAADARTALERGADGILVSNHGGRNLDGAPAAIEALPRVVEVVADRVPVLVDGGVRRGTDVVRALALGARAVLIGRPYVYGLAWDGADGVRAVIETLRRELMQTMGMCGAPRLADIGPDLLW